LRVWEVVKQEVEMRNLTSAALMLLLSFAACSSAAKGTSYDTPNNKIVVQVRNDAFYDANVYMIRSSSERIRLGIANGNSTTNLTVPRSAFTSIDDVRFLITWIGRSGHDTSESILAQAGDTIGLQIR
jgi:hypothetical protein